MKPFVKRGLALLVVVGLGAGAWALWLRPEPIPVTVRPVERGRVEETVTNSKAGTVRTRRRASLSAEMAGRIEELNVREGQRVTTGQVLLRLADADLRAQREVSSRALDSARAQSRDACAGAEQARRDLERMRSLSKQEIVSQDRLEQAGSVKDRATAACQAAAASARQAEAEITLADAMLAKTMVRAPFDGVVAEVRAEVGEFLAPSAPGVFIPPVLDLIDDTALYVSAPLDEVDIGRVVVDLPVRVTLDPYPDTPLAGRVSRVAPYVEDQQQQSRTFEVEVELDGALPSGIVVKPGATADVEIILRAVDSVLRIPSFALLEGSKVLVAREGRLVSVNVTTGLRNWEFVEILSGLKLGDPVVVSLDREEVKEGARVVASEVASP
jgi:HlyD family secretion protein